MNEEKLSALLDRTTVYQQEVFAHVRNCEPIPLDRPIVAFQSGLLSLEHAAGVHVLLRGGVNASAYALLRPQFEALVRGIWSLHAASERWIEKLSEPLTSESERQANGGPTLKVMLEQLNRSDAPPHITEQLEQYRDAAWKAMNSYTHGGIHPLSRTATGYPPQLTMNVILNSNAILAMTAQLVAITAAGSDKMQRVRELHSEYSDCIPME